MLKFAPIVPFGAKYIWLIEATHFYKPTLHPQIKLYYHGITIFPFKEMA